MERKEDTPERERKRTYEAKHKEERKSKSCLIMYSITLKLGKSNAY